MEQAWTVIQNVIQLNGGILHIELTNITGFVGGQYLLKQDHTSTPPFDRVSLITAALSRGTFTC